MYAIQMISTCCSFKTALLKMVANVGMVGNEYTPRTGGRVRSLRLPKSSWEVN